MAVTVPATANCRHWVPGPPRPLYGYEGLGQLSIISSARSGQGAVSEMRAYPFTVTAQQSNCLYILHNLARRCCEWMNRAENKPTMGTILRERTGPALARAAPTLEWFPHG